MEARAGVVCVGLTTLDVLGRTIDSIPEGGAVQFIDEIRLTVAGTAGGTAVDCAKLGVPTTLVPTLFLVPYYCRYNIACDVVNIMCPLVVLW